MKKQYGMKLDSDLIDKLDALASKSGTTRTAMIEGLICAAVNPETVVTIVGTGKPTGSITAGLAQMLDPAQTEAQKAPPEYRKVKAPTQTSRIIGYSASDGSPIYADVVKARPKGGKK